MKNHRSALVFLLVAVGLGSWLGAGCSSSQVQSGSIKNRSAEAEVKVTAEHNGGTAPFQFKSIPAPVKNDAATSAKFTLLDGQRDQNGAELAACHDGRLPTGEDQPAENFFFRAGSQGGRLLVELQSAIDIKQIGTYSWHGGARGPQVYRLFGSDGTSTAFKASPAKGAEAQNGWKLLANVDTRPKDGDGGGQHGVLLSASSGGNLGKYRYLLFDISPTETRDAFGHTFYSEIDIIDANGPAPIAATTGANREPVLKSFTTDDGKYHFTFDATIAPDLMEWAETKLQPVVKEWYPKLVAMLPSEGFKATTNVTLRFRDDMGGTPASAGGGRINMNAGWFRKELKREAVGSIVHEMVHVVQSYGRARRDNPNATRMPGWLVEGIPDYIRWFLYEPETKGAEITERNLARAKYDASYRISGNFLNWVTEKYDRELVRKLNAAGREGKYSEQLWKDWTGKTLQELGDEWKKGHEERLAKAKAAEEAPAPSEK